MYCSEQAFVVCFSGFLTYFGVYITQLLSETARIRFGSQVEEEKRIVTIWYMSMKLLLSSVPVYCMETLGHKAHVEFSFGWVYRLACMKHLLKF